MQRTAQTDAPGKYALSVVYVFFPYVLSESLSLLSNCFLSEAYTCIYIFMCAHMYVGIYIFVRRGELTQDSVHSGLNSLT